MTSDIVPIAKLRFNKDEKDSALLRQEGNAAFKSDDFVTALTKYSASIATAPCDTNTTGLALAFANRSAVQFLVKNHEQCLSDIEQAFETNYPKRLQHKLLKRMAECHHALGNMEQAKKCFEEAIECSPEEEKESVVKQLATLEAPDHFDLPRLRVRPPPELYLGENLLIPGAAACIAIEHNEKYGRHIVATEDIPPGVVLFVEKPYVAVLKLDYYEDFCFHCLRWYDAKIPCRTCALVTYCSEACRDASWEESHEIECPLLIELALQVVDPPIYAALHMFVIALKKHGTVQELYDHVAQLDAEDLKGIKGCDADGRYEPTELRTVHNLLSLNVVIFNEHGLFNGDQDSLLFDLIVARTNLLDNESMEIKQFVHNLLKRYVRIFSRNSSSIICYPLTEVDDQKHGAVEVATGLYSISALLNHQCIPNCNSYCRGNTKVYFATVPIAKGDQVFDCYNKVDRVQFRARNLSVSELGVWYDFTCDCPLCIDPDKLATHNWPKCPRCNTVVYVKMPQVFTKCDHCSNRFSVKHVMSLCSQVLQEIMDIGVALRDVRHVPAISEYITRLAQMTSISADVSKSVQDILTANITQAGLYYFNNFTYDLSALTSHQ